MAKSPVSTSSTKEGKVLVERDKRINARNIREIEAAGITRISVPEDFLYGRALAKNVIDQDTGEVVAKANDEITEELLGRLREANDQGNPDALYQ